ncbi:mRNA splicing factor [Marasmius fiardii PR-910]|nr:mRNA splicing factor [Marasmius fiardii PR-910]
MSLAEVAETRKARLLALKKRKEGNVDDAEPILRSRNFDPDTRTLKKRTRDDDAEMQDTVEKNVKGLAEQIITEDETKRAEELDIFNIAPKRPNWDLKRETDKKLAKLERKTQEAIHTLIRQRLAAEKGQSEDLLGAMKAEERAHADDEPTSDED